MNIVLQIFLISCLLFFLILVIYYLSKNRLQLKYSLTWLLAIITMLFVTIFPQTVELIGHVVGIASPVNTIFLFTGMFMVLILFTLTFIVSHMNRQIYKLAQSIALLEKRVRELEQEIEIKQKKSNA